MQHALYLLQFWEGGFCVIHVIGIKIHQRVPGKMLLFQFIILTFVSLYESKYSLACKYYLMSEHFLRCKILYF